MMTERERDDQPERSETAYDIVKRLVSNNPRFREAPSSAKAVTITGARPQPRKDDPQ
jgi:hypothetical protein